MDVFDQEELTSSSEEEPHDKPECMSSDPATSRTTTFGGGSSSTAPEHLTSSSDVQAVDSIDNFWRCQQPARNPSLGEFDQEELSTSEEDASCIEDRQAVPVLPVDVTRCGEAVLLEVLTAAGSSLRSESHELQGASGASAAPPPSSPIVAFEARSRALCAAEPSPASLPDPPAPAQSTQSQSQSQKNKRGPSPSNACNSNGNTRLERPSSVQSAGDHCGLACRQQAHESAIPGPSQPNQITPMEIQHAVSGPTGRSPVHSVKGSACTDKLMHASAVSLRNTRVLAIQDRGKGSDSDVIRPSSTYDLEDEDLYGGIECVPAPPSEFELSAQLAAVQQERLDLEAELRRLKDEFGAKKQRLESGLRSACVLLKTARLELRRKQAHVAEAQARRTSAVAKRAPHL